MPAKIANAPTAKAPGPVRSAMDPVLLNELTAFLREYDHALETGDRAYLSAHTVWPLPYTATEYNMEAKAQSKRLATVDALLAGTPPVREGLRLPKAVLPATPQALAQFEAAIAAPDCDALIWTFRKNPAVLQDPRMYGWVDADALNRVRRVSVKVPLSDQPMNDHAVIGAFTFKRAGDFVSAAEAMIRANRRIKNEFYVDEAMNVAVEQGLRVKVFEVQHYICWGTPRDLDTYNYWHGWFADTGL